MDRLVEQPDLIARAEEPVEVLGEERLAEAIDIRRPEQLEIVRHIVVAPPAGAVDPLSGPIGAVDLRSVYRAKGRPRSVLGRKVDRTRAGEPDEGPERAGQPQIGQGLEPASE